MLLPILRKLANHEKLNHRAQSAAEQLYARLTRKSEKKVQGRLRRNSEKQSARASHNQETAKIREEVMKRADGFCECGCGRPFSDEYYARGPELDHWLSGSGRRRQKQAVANTWMLTRLCHEERTYHEPSVAVWNHRFAFHAAKYGYPPLPHIIHTEPAKAGGAP